MLRVDDTAIADLLEDAYADEVDGPIRAITVLEAMAGARSGAFFRFSGSYDGGSFCLRSVRDMTLIGPDTTPLDVTLPAIAGAPSPERAFGKTQGLTYSQSSGLGAGLPTVPGWRDCWCAPVQDALGLVSLDSHGEGLCLTAGLDEVTSIAPGEARLLMRLATHLGASDRLRSVDRARRLDAADVVLSPTGRLLHGANVSRSRAVSIRDGIERRRFARKSRHDAEKALEVWQGLVDGRWSIVDHVDTDGKRFVLAMKNAPEVDPRDGLPPEERRVAALAAMGHRDKEIAYMLGISPATVAALLRRVRVALRVKTRAELAAAWRRGTGLSADPGAPQALIRTR